MILRWVEEKLLYFPEPWNDADRWLAEHLPQPKEGEVGARIEDRWIDVPGGPRLHAWWAVPTTREGGRIRDVPCEPALLWLHGNAGNVPNRLDMLLKLAALPVRVLLLDYRGYGRSEGKPSEAGLYADARAAWDHMTHTLEVPPEKAVVLGKSLGGGVATHLATQVTPAGLIVQSSFTSIPAMAARIYPFIPRRLVSTRMDSLSRVPHITCPKLFVHGARDELIPVDMGRRLHAAAAAPKRLLELPRAMHNDAYVAEPGAYFDGLRTFVEECAG